MSIIIKTNSAFTDTSIPILYRDQVITPSTQFVFDALDTYSWPKQGTPLTTDVWQNLASGSNATFNVVPGWSSGFTFSGGASGSRIFLPTSGKVASNQTSGFLVIVWFKTTTVASGTLQSIAGITGGTPATAQWMLYLDGAKVITGSNGAAGPQINGNAANTVYQVALAYDGDGAGNFVRSSWRNGQLIGQNAPAAAASILQPSDTNPGLGRMTGLPSLQGTIYRCVFDTLTTTKSVAEIVAADYAANVGRFV